MNRKHLQRAVSFCCAAALCMQAFAGAEGYVLLSHAANPARIERMQRLTGDAVQDDTPVPVIVTLESEGVLSNTDDAEYLESPDAAAESERLLAMQEPVIAALRERYPELEIRYQYTTLMNGFSCELPPALIAAAEQIAGVQSVQQSGRVKLSPQMAKAAKLGGFPAYYEETGCRGEGQAIAVIDMELDITHPMFAALPDDVETKITQDDVAKVASGIGFHVKIDPAKAYRSNKLPYVIDYTQDPYNSLANTEAYHGTHVAGIAAGNPYTDSSGQVISGAAPNAQIVFMAIDGATTNFEDVLIAAIEDAVKLHVDAINMSLGIEGENMGRHNPFRDAVNAAEKAGITVCISAGNSDNGEVAFQETHTAENPDVSTMNGFITEDTKALAVASANNPVSVRMKAMSLGDRSIPYSGCAGSRDWKEHFLGDSIGNGPFAYEYCGLGYPEDFSGKDLTGKLALVDRGVLYFTDKAKNAAAAGAVGVIVIQNNSEIPYVMQSDANILLAMVSKEDGEALRNAEEQKVSFSDQYVDVDYDNVVSDYTSWGVQSSMDLRPDIMGIGGMVESAAYNNSTSLQQGTSMSSPYLAGCAVILDEYLEKNGFTLTGSEKQQYIRNLLMTGAKPYREDDMFVTPRRQGAGLVSLSSSIHSKILLTGAEGESKISLRDGLGTSFTVPVTLRNISDEDVRFSAARIELTTDAANYDSSSGQYLVKGQQPLRCSADCGAVTAIAAGETKTVEIPVSLDAAQAAELKTIFTNGFFIEGYLLLEGAENSADISIPLVGFSDAFSDIPILKSDIHAYAAVRDDSVPNGLWGISAGAPFAEQAALASDILKRANSQERSQLRSDDANMLMNAVYIYMKYEQSHSQHFTQPAADVLYLSPNQDGFADIGGFGFTAKRNYLFDGADLYDSEGRLAAKGFAELQGAKEGLPIGEITIGELAYTTAANLSKLSEGTYQAELRCYLDSDASRQHPQTYRIPVIIDKTAPKLISAVKEENGRKILTLTASDQALDGFYIIGKGKGGEAGRYDPQNSGSDGILPFAGSVIATTFYGVQFANTFQTFGWQSPFGSYNPKNVPLYGRFWMNNAQETEQNQLAQCDFSDVIAAEPDAAGNAVLRYDVTDLSSYTVTVTDRAFNFTSVDQSAADMTPQRIESGIYQSLSGLYAFSGDTLQYTSFMTNETVSFRYGLSGGVLTLQASDGKSYSADITGSAEAGYALQGISGDALGMLFGEIEMLKRTDLTDAKDYLAIGGYDAEKTLVLPPVRKILGETAVVKPEYEMLPDAVLRYSYGKKDGKDIMLTVDLKTGALTLPEGFGIDIPKKDDLLRGDTDCSGDVDVSDAVLLARMIAEDSGAVVTAKGLRNADCDRNGSIEQNDVILILKSIAKMISFDE